MQAKKCRQRSFCIATGHRTTRNFSHSAYIQIARYFGMHVCLLRYTAIVLAIGIWHLSLESVMTKLKNLALTILFMIVPIWGALAQSDFKDQLCTAAVENRVAELVYDQDASKDCKPRLIDVHQVAIGKNGKLYVHGWQSRGCTSGRDYASKRIFRIDKIQSVELIEGEFSEKSQSIKDEGWDGCIGSNCFIKENICE